MLPVLFFGKLIMKYNLNVPISKEKLKFLRSGDIVLLSGIIYTARDAAHKRLTEEFNTSGSFPIALKNQVIYYAGPCPAKPGEIIGSCGPTTAGRMDAYTPLLLEHGLCAVIGKGSRNDAVKKAMHANGAVYFGAYGGAGALISQCIKSSEIVAYSDLGTEAIRRLRIENFPTVVLFDTNGNDLYEAGQKKYCKL